MEPSDPRTYQDAEEAAVRKELHNFAFLAAAVATAGGSVTIQPEDILRFNAQFMLDFKPTPAGGVVLTLRKRPNAVSISEILKKVLREEL